jgi:hypothetical protein
MLIGGFVLSIQHFGILGVDRVLAEISEKTGIEITRKNEVIGLGSVQLQTVTVSGFLELNIANIIGEFSVNPLSENFLKVTSLEVKGLNLTATDQDANMIEAVKILRRVSNPSETTENNSPSKLNSIRKLFAEQARLVITDASGSVTKMSDNQSITVTGLHGVLDPASLKFNFFAAEISHSTGENLRQVKGYLDLSQPKTLRLQIGGPRADGLQDWLATVELTKIGSSATAVFDFSGMPEVISHHLEGIISTPGSLEVQGTVTAEKIEDGKYRFSGTSQFSPLSVQHHLLSREPIGPIVPGIRYTGTVDTNIRRAIVKKLVVTFFSPVITTKSNFPGIQMGMSVTGDFSNKDSPIGSWAGILKIPRTSCQTALDVAPTGLTPGIKDFLLSGEFILDADLRFDSQYPDRYYFQATKTGFTCKVESAPTEYSAERIRNGFRFSKSLTDGTLHQFVLEPGSPQFTPLGLISRHMVTAVVSSEDAGFWSNDGIDLSAIDGAMRNNLKNNKVLSGGSTITMQTVKNLFLSRTRTISRKAPELFLSWYLHNTVTKDRLMEIYLNIIEFGPGIYGITQAAEHFFRKRPSDLDLKEAVYLASVLPSPVRRYRQFCNGKLSPGYENLINEKLGQMYGQGRIPLETMEETRGLTLNFNVIAPASQYTCTNLETN